MNPDKLVRLSKHEIKKRKEEKRSKTQSFKDKRENDRNANRTRKHIQYIESQKLAIRDLAVSQEERLAEIKPESE